MDRSKGFKSPKLGELATNIKLTGFCLSLKHNLTYQEAIFWNFLQHILF